MRILKLLIELYHRRQLNVSVRSGGLQHVQELLPVDQVQPELKTSGRDVRLMRRQRHGR
jgi:hypothetical protein